MRRGRSPSPLQKSTDHPPASYDRDLALKHDHIRCSSASSRLTVSPLGRRCTDPRQQARADSLLLSEADRRRTTGMAAPSRPPKRGEEAGNCAPLPQARGASSPTRSVRVKLSPRGVSPRCIMTGRHTCKPSLKARFRAGVLSHQHFCNRLHRRHRISKMSIWFSTAILLDEAAAARAVH
jgi:hypothetical protein